ncbi:MAG: hypothetical protein HN737_03390 [Desulfobacterales bacterium]|nr:hypothetical protein [Desulfobacteraceae bacterium]MBT4365052.1 hypothetical protein [Desulfobacteraceae bacterium]MBT7696436.1 hypothetical protein [Desulfobacterales bacterium]
MKMESIKETQKKYCSRALFTAIVLFFVFYLCKLIPVGKGLLLGTIFSVINFVLIGFGLPMKMGKTRKNVFFLSLGSIFIRFLLLAIPIVAAIKLKQFNLVAVVAGLFSVQLVLLSDHLFNLILSKRQKQL